MVSVKDKEVYKKRFKEILGKKIDTTMIFSINQFEISFGYLWGHGLEESSLDDEQKIARRVWEQVRSSILDLGNAQKRNMMKEINEHDIIRHRHEYTLIPSNNWNNSGNK
jgi:hypothetical protein